MRWVIVSLVWAGAMLAAPVSAQTPERLLTYGITGSVTSQGYENPTVLLSRIEVQRTVLAAAREGIGDTEARAMLSAGGDVTPEHLVSANIFRRSSDGRYRVAFNLVTAEDRARIDAVIAPYAQSLVDAIMRRQSRFDALFARYDPAGADRRQLAFLLIGCVGLDWDGLDLTAEMGLRTPARVWPNGDRFVLWAREQGPSVSYRGLYWGSHNSEREDRVWLTTFGDHDALPRSGLPDAANEFSGAINRSRLTPDASRALRLYTAPYVQTFMDRSARLMLRLREGPATAAQLATQSGVDAADAEATLSALAGFGYVRETEGVYAASVIVLREGDRAMTDAVRAEVRAIMRQWLRTNAPRLRADLAELSALRSGVAYEALFTELWHYLFGAANLRLSQLGYIADPYAEDARWRGFVPFVWESSLELNE